jgi:hypothetical protein
VNVRGSQKRAKVVTPQDSPAAGARSEKCDPVNTELGEQILIYKLIRQPKKARGMD